MGRGKVKYLITGATGSFGSAYIRRHTKDEIVVYSRDWQKQKALRDELGNPNNITWVIGDVRDKERLIYAMKNVNVVIHAAAIKCIDACEQNAIECLMTNVLGTQNVLDAMRHCNVSKGILISTDKAVMPINVYGTSKKMAEKLWIACGHSVCRYGNVIGSSGSVLTIYKKLIKEGAKKLPITDERMTRFWYKMDEAIELVDKSINNYIPGTVHIPEIPSIKITDLCEALCLPYHVIGVRPGEKLHEYMIAPDDITGDEGYSSGNNDHFLTVHEIRASIDGV